MKLTFFGAAGTVTGSKYLVEAGSTRVLVDCGLYQGLKELRERNWASPPFDPATLDAVVLTHAHIDHSGYLPVLVQHGFRGPIWCTGATADLCRILLPDSAFIQEEDARFANLHGFSKHHPARPLYDRDDVYATLPLLRPVEWDERITIGDLDVHLTPAGHLLGAASAHVDDGATRVLFSGDLGRADDILFRPPRRPTRADVLVMESTYGDRLHADHDPAALLEGVVNDVCGRGGVLMVPAFAVGRAQALLHLLANLTRERRIPRIPTFLDSPMAISATDTFRDHPSEHRLDEAACRELGEHATFVRDPEGSKALDRRQGPMILLAGSGMASGGRILHHLKVFGPDRRNAILLTGHQAAGTRGEVLANGGRELKIHGQEVVIEAEVRHLTGLSGHADRAGLVDWLRDLPAPRRVFVTHGEPGPATAFSTTLREVYGWSPVVPSYGASFEL